MHLPLNDCCSSVAEALKVGSIVPPQAFESATVLFSDIVGFTQKCSLLTPLEVNFCWKTYFIDSFSSQVVTMLNNVYSQFDTTIAASDAYKVETVGDCYMVVSGVPTPNGKKHADALASLALAMLDVCNLISAVVVAPFFADCVHDGDATGD